MYRINSNTLKKQKEGKEGRREEGRRKEKLGIKCKERKMEISGTFYSLVTKLYIRE